jgi:hypothetical protein
MKKIALLIIVAALTGCAAPINPGVTAYRSYIAENRPLAEGGSLKWSAYYEGLYSKSMAAGAPDYMLNGANEMIDFAHQYESGAITQDQFQHHRRSIQARVVGRSQSDANQAQADRQRQVDAVAAAMATNPIPAQQAQPYMIPVRRSIQTSCQTFGNSTDCTTR